MDIMHNNQLNKSLNAFMISDNIRMFAGGAQNIQSDMAIGPGIKNKKHSDDVRLISSMSNTNAISQQRGNILDAIALEQAAPKQPAAYSAILL